MAPTKVIAAIVAKPFAIHHSSSPSFATPRLLSAIPKALSVSAATLSLRRSHSVSAVAHPSSASPTPTPAIVAPSSLRRFLFDEPHEGTDIIVEALEREGIIKVFAYPDNTSMEIHQPLTRSPFITNHLLRHEQGEIFATSGYARSTSHLGICIATSGPGALTWSPATLTPSSTSSPWSPSPASSGCPGPVLVDIPKDIQQLLSIPV